MKISKATGYALHAMMYLVRHRTQLPIPAERIAKAEGIPLGYLSKILQQLAKAGFLTAVRGPRQGYNFARQPEDIYMLELFEATEGEPLFDDCFLKHCDCQGTTENCYIYARWNEVTQKMKKVLEETSLVTATWNHPEHRFQCPLSVVPNPK